MKETRLLGEIIPAIPEYLDLLSALRDKYDIPLLGPDVDEEVLPGLLGLDFDPEKVKQEIFDYLNSNPPLPESMSNFILNLEEIPPERTLRQFLIDTADELPEELTVGNTLQKFTFSITDKIKENVANMLFVRLMTGKIDEIPKTWLGGVEIIPLFGSLGVFALASELTDINQLVADLRKNYYKIFGRKKKRLTNEKLEGAQYLRLRLEGYKARDSVDVHVSLHQKEYDQIKDPQKRREYKQRAYGRIKKQISRLQEYLDQYRDI